MSNMIKTIIGFIRNYFGGASPTAAELAWNAYVDAAVEADRLEDEEERLREKAFCLIDDSRSTSGVEAVVRPTPDAVWTARCEWWIAQTAAAKARVEADLAYDAALR